MTNSPDRWKRYCCRYSDKKKYIADASRPYYPHQPSLVTSSLSTKPSRQKRPPPTSHTTHNKTPPRSAHATHILVSQIRPYTTRRGDRLYNFLIHLLEPRIFYTTRCLRSQIQSTQLQKRPLFVLLPERDDLDKERPRPGVPRSRPGEQGSKIYTSVRHVENGEQKSFWQKYSGSRSRIHKLFSFFFFLLIVPKKWLDPEDINFCKWHERNT